jgi:hypothetical protein
MNPKTIIFALVAALSVYGTGAFLTESEESREWRLRVAADRAERNTADASPQAMHSLKGKGGKGKVLCLLSKYILSFCHLICSRFDFFYRSA